MSAAQSWSTDAHKTLNVPYDSGLAIVRDEKAMRAVFSATGDYLILGEGDPSDRTPELSRRARGFAVYAALRSLGRDGVDELVVRMCANARQMAAGLASIPGVEIVNDVVFTQVMLACADDMTTTRLGERMLADGVAVFTPGAWGGRAHPAVFDVELGDHARRRRADAGGGTPTRPRRLSRGDGARCLRRVCLTRERVASRVPRTAPSPGGSGSPASRSTGREAASR